MRFLCVRGVSTGARQCSSWDVDQTGLCRALWKCAALIELRAPNESLSDF